MKMNKEQRKPYHELITLTPYGLCNICKFAKFYGSCDYCELECHHPLDVINGFDDDAQHVNDTWAGGDCWAFRPRISLQQVGVMVGINLEGGHFGEQDGEIVRLIE